MLPDIGLNSPLVLLVPLAVPPLIVGAKVEEELSTGAFVFVAEASLFATGALLSAGAVPGEGPAVYGIAPVAVTETGSFEVIAEAGVGAVVGK